MKTISLIVKFLSVITGIGAYNNVIPAKYAPLAAFAFVIASTLKDLVIHIGDWLDNGKLDNSYNPSASSSSDAPSKTGGTLNLLLALSVMSASFFLLTGCQSPRLEAGGAYAPAIVTTNMDGTVTTMPTAAPDMPLFVADSAYKLAYDAVDGVLLFEYNNRAELQQKFPKLKPALDKIRPEVWDVEVRWAKARKAYLASPTPAGLSQLQTMLGELQRLVPVAQAALASNQQN